MELYRPAFKFETNAIEVDTWIGKLLLTPIDTELQLFDDPNSKQFENVEHILSDNDQLNPAYAAQVGHVYGFTPSDELRAWLIDNHFPRRSRPVCDAVSYDWYLNMIEQDFIEAPNELHVEDINGTES